MISVPRSFYSRSTITLKMKQLTVNRNLYCSFVTRKIYPSICPKLLVSYKANAVVQQDNVRPQINVNDPEESFSGQEEDGDINLARQPAKSLEFNAVDFRYFISFKASARKMSMKICGILLMQ